MKTESTNSPPLHIVAVSGYITDSEQRVLLVRSALRDTWELPGGQVENDETLTDALVREVREESGITVSVGGLRAVHANLSRSIVVLGFRGQFVSGELSANGVETTEVAWFQRSQALPLIGRPAMRLRFEDLGGDDVGVIFRAYTMSPFTVIATSRH